MTRVRLAAPHNKRQRLGTTTWRANVSSSDTSGVACWLFDWATKLTPTEFKCTVCPWLRQFGSCSDVRCTQQPTHSEAYRLKEHFLNPQRRLLLSLVKKENIALKCYDIIYFKCSFKGFRFLFDTPLDMHNKICSQSYAWKVSGASNNRWW